MPLLSVSGLSKSFLGVSVLEDVDFEVDAGEVLGLVGENGAGKSTVMKLLGGVYLPDSGAITLDGKLLRLGRPLEAEQAGISTVYQEFNLLPDRSVAENVFLGQEPSRLGVVNSRLMMRRTRELLDSIGVDGIGPTDLVNELSVAQQQMVEIAKAVSVEARIIQMDEPTSALAEHEVALLNDVIARLRSTGVGIIYVSHRLREIFNLCDRVVILKDGRRVATHGIEDLTEPEVVRLMVGRPIADYFPEMGESEDVGQAALQLKSVGNEWVDGVDLEIRTGEILGVAGLQGSGRSELLAGVFGAVPFTRGEVLAAAGTGLADSPRQAIRQGIAMVPEDRKGDGLLLDQTISDNCLAVIRAVAPGQTATARKEVAPTLARLEVVARSMSQEVRFLSGGNQQKVVLAKWLVTEPGVLLMDEPTRGIDVGAKVAIYNLMRELARAGYAIVMVSSELPELIGMADRIVVMRDGRLVDELPAGSTEVDILAAAMGASTGSVA